MRIAGRLGTVRSAVLTLHAIIAGFVFPSLLLFFWTGAIAMFGEEGTTVTEDYQIPLKGSSALELDDVLSLLVIELNRRGIDLQNHKQRVTQLDEEILILWRGVWSTVSATIRNEDSAIASVRVAKRSLQNVLMKIHEGDASKAFNLYAALSSLAMLVATMLGVMAASLNRALRTLTLVSVAFGTVVFFVLITMAV